jgi:RNA recognition motif-containing protein
MKNTFWEIAEEVECAVPQRQRAYTDMCFNYGSDVKSIDFDLGSPRSTATGNSSSGSVAGDVSDRWADFCDTDDELSSQPRASFSSTASSPPSIPERPAGIWFLPPVYSQQVSAQSLSLKANVATEQITIARDDGTTLILKNLPDGCTHHALCRALDEIGLGACYDFVYVPYDFKKSVGFRYGFVNFERHEQAVKAMAILDGFNGWAVNGEQGCEVEWSGSQQSLHELVERYRNSPVMHVSVPDVYKPILLEKGVRIAFPAPTRAVNPPKHLNQPALQTPNAEADPPAEESAARHTQVQQAAARDCRTTLVVKNLPLACTHNELRRILDEVGLGGSYNFIYVPFDFKKSVVLRYGFVNFEGHEQAVKAMSILDGVSDWTVDGEKGFEVEWGDAQQSLQANIERYRNSPLMHDGVPDEYRPVIFERGVRVAFPAPTKAVKPLKFRRAQQA